MREHSQKQLDIDESDKKTTIVTDKTLEVKIIAHFLLARNSLS